MRAVIETAESRTSSPSRTAPTTPSTRSAPRSPHFSSCGRLSRFAELRGKEVEQIVGRRLANAYRRQEGKAANGAEAEATPVETK